MLACLLHNNIYVLGPGQVIRDGDAHDFEAATSLHKWKLVCGPPASAFWSGQGLSNIKGWQFSEWSSVEWGTKCRNGFMAHDFHENTDGNVSVELKFMWKIKCRKNNESGSICRGNGKRTFQIRIPFQNQVYVGDGRWEAKQVQSHPEMS